MKYKSAIIAVAIALAVAGGIGVYAYERRGVDANPAHIDAPGAVAVVELFTSEGCSSCPPADDLLASLVNESAGSHRHVYSLAFHVDSWNRPEWNDPFSDSRFTKRQDDYAATHVTAGAGTPQMVINGSREVEAWEPKVVRAAIDEAMQTPGTVDLKLTAARTGDEVTAEVDVAESGKGSALNIALVERGLTRAVKGGENSGRTLHHQNVVRGFQTLKIDSLHLIAHLPLPEKTSLNQCSVIAYVQGPHNWVVGATESPIADSSSTTQSSR